MRFESNTSGHLRPAAIAGTFYPADPDVLRQVISEHLAVAQPAPEGFRFRAAIVPHAGLIYSGPIAASVYAALKQQALRIRRVIILGPAHRLPIRGIAAPRSNAFETPLGAITVDQSAIDELLSLGLVHRDDSVHALEHSVEIQLPFLDAVLNDFQIVPLAVGSCSFEDTRRIIEHFAESADTICLVSSDLSHFHSYEEAQEIDGATISSILNKRPEDLGQGAACGRLAIGGLLQHATAQDLEVRLLDARSSGDTAGDHRRVVGYASFLVGIQRP